MAPFDGTAASGGDGDTPPSSSIHSLKLAFSKAADFAAIDALFDPALKGDKDPHGYVARRLETVFRDAVTAGCAATLSDPSGTVQALSIAYRVHDTPPAASGTPPDYTECGTSLAVLQGYNAARLVIAALALREWLHAPPREDMVAHIKTENGPSIRTYQDVLGWEPIMDRGRYPRINEITDRTLADDKDKGKEQEAVPPPHPGAPPVYHWYRCGDAALAAQARILLEFMDQGGLLNKHTGQTIPVDFSALDGEGLTRARLEALARGPAGP